MVLHVQMQSHFSGPWGFSSFCRFVSWYIGTWFLCACVPKYESIFLMSENYSNKLHIPLKKRWSLTLFTVQLLISNHQGPQKKDSIRLTETACVRLPAANFGYKWSATGVRQTPCLEGGMCAPAVVKLGAWLSELGTPKTNGRKTKSGTRDF